MAAELILTVFLDGLMALLLIITTFYCWRLNKRIRILQDSKSELANIIRQFDDSTQRATDSITEIHAATSRIAENMQHKIDKANYLADDLQFMIEKGNKIADRMEGGIASGRSRSSGRMIEDDEPPVQSSRRNDMRLVGKKVEVEADRVPARKAGGSDSTARSSLESVLKKVSNRNAEADNAAEADADAGKRRRAGARLRSKAEQELFDALKAGGDKV